MKLRRAIGHADLRVARPDQTILAGLSKSAEQKGNDLNIRQRLAVRGGRGAQYMHD
jgi:hypothetical protein